MLSMRSRCFVPALAASCLIAPAASAIVVHSGSLGSLSATASFDVSGNNLVVTLTNDSMADVTIPAQILTTLLFRIEGGAINLTPVSALLANGSVVIYDSQPAGGNVGGEWAYEDGLSLGGSRAGLQYGIGSAGLGVFGQANFNGPDLDSPTAVNGLNYGITSAGDNPATGNGGVTGSGGLIKNSVVFTLSGLPNNFDLTRITEAMFIYGTAFGEGEIRVPAPGSAALVGLAGVAMLRRRR